MPPFLRAPLPLQCSTILRLLSLLPPLISLRLQMGSLTSASDVCDLLTINPLVVLHQNTCTIHSKSSNSCLVLDSIFKLLLLRILRKRELGFCLSSIIARHGSSGKTKKREDLGSIITRHCSSGKTKKREVASKSTLYLKGLMGAQP